MQETRLSSGLCGVWLAIREQYLLSQQIELHQKFQYKTRTAMCLREELIGPISNIPVESALSASVVQKVLRASIERADMLV